MFIAQRIAIMTGIIALATSVPAAALESEGELGGVRFGVYAPDWTWQDRDVNVMAVFENGSDAAVSCSIALDIPADLADHFGRNGAPTDITLVPFVQEVNVHPGEVQRIALTGITALQGFPRQTYPLTLTVRANERDTIIPYSLRTIRGQAVSKGRAVALGMPIGVALIFSAAFAIVLRNAGNPEAWKIVPLPATEPNHPESWINQVPK